VLTFHCVRPNRPPPDKHLNQTEGDAMPAIYPGTVIEAAKKNRV
jgi:hypothetical protein